MSNKIINFKINNIFLLGLFFLFLISGSANIMIYNLPHFDLNLSKLIFLFFFIFLNYYLYKSYSFFFKFKKKNFLFYIFLSWIIYLIINILISEFKLLSVKMLFRLIISLSISFLFLDLLRETRLRIKFKIVLFCSIIFIFFKTFSIYLYKIFTGPIVFGYKNENNYLWEDQILYKELPEWYESFFPGYQFYFIKGEIGNELNRLVGFFQNPNELGFYIVTLFIIYIFFINENTNYRLDIIIILSIFLMTTFSFSRNALIGLFFSSIYLIYKINQVNYKNKKFVYIIISTLILIATYFNFGQFKQGFVFIKDLGKTILIKENANQSNQIISKNTILETYSKSKKLDSFGERVQHWERVINLWKKNIWLGYGLNNFHSLSEDYPGKDKKLYNEHSFILGILGEQGLIGLVILFILIIKISLIKSENIFICLSFISMLIFDKFDYSYTFWIGISCLIPILIYKSNSNKFS